VRDGELQRELGDVAPPLPRVLAARRATSRTSGVALCHAGSGASVSSRAENGAAFMMPTPRAFSIGTRSANIVFCSV
jgi:hypothetical protein